MEPSAVLARADEPTMTFMTTPMASGMRFTVTSGDDGTGRPTDLLTRQVQIAVADNDDDGGGDDDDDAGGGGGQSDAAAEEHMTQIARELLRPGVRAILDFQENLRSQSGAGYGSGGGRVGGGSGVDPLPPTRSPSPSAAPPPNPAPPPRETVAAARRSRKRKRTADKGKGPKVDHKSRLKAYRGNMTQACNELRDVVPDGFRSSSSRVAVVQGAVAYIRALQQALVEGGVQAPRGPESRELSHVEVANQAVRRIGEMARLVEDELVVGQRRVAV
ncbi:uncharacterized protein AMSG_08017 [Thecamonas trahens ATCC 50062]|uniref:BHLH domain-containing protein n=1 Tax=Thecamonas trahens ATCC 50062 TaxID=461836 RepID=A0A0L0DJT5_THETB|nr:hypothetical protein AMSG_08017 [Thecamonas trahens ATCC 50062]KNC52460.1 hypothetical protein AMSG_08017 [Thecamonas trahens ATCC 50062]|eukprot:XP_013755263.1 hypothetical protein AMSG_08017 [Thecamonas trahens ATCC 50062]